MGGREADTRTQLIDPAIEQAGWDLHDPAQVGIEIPVDGVEAEPWNGVTDYVLYRDNGDVLAVVEAKRSTHDPNLAQQQTEHYVREIEKRQSFRPFAFMTNGHQISFLDLGHSAKRRVHGFFSREDLERLLTLRQTRQPLTSIPINQDITNRPYQIEGIKRVTEAFERENRRKALLVMATGTGKTRTAMALIDIFMRANHARNILFIADRNALVRQARTEGFETHLPDEPCARIFSTNIDTVKSNRLFVATLQTMSTQYDQFTPGFFDLIVFDEVHRSIFNKYKVVIDYFDARMIGLTATPANFIDRSTFEMFDCLTGAEDPIPTYLYTYQQAIDEGYLVDFRLYRAQTLKQTQGIKGAFLTEEERNQLLQEGLDPDEIDYEGTDLERTVSNQDTLRKQWAEFMDMCVKDEAGKPCKTIVFAMTQEHALRLEGAFNQMYPQYPEMVKVITYKSEYKGQSLGQFKQEDMPRIAISVDMLETGVNVPEVMTLVFMRPVQSQIKMQQMIGRGTRTKDASKFPERLPNGEKDHFLIIDFWENDFNKDADENVSATLPVLVRLFNTRLTLIEDHLRDPQTAEAQRLIRTLREMIARIPQQAFEVQKKLNEQPHIAEAWENRFWRRLTTEKLNLLRNQVAPLLRFAPDVDVAAETFTHKAERLRERLRSRKETQGVIESIRDDVDRLPDFVFDHREQGPVADMVLSRDFEQPTDAQLNAVIDVLAPQMRKRRKSQSSILKLDLADRVHRRGYVLLGKSGEEVYIDRYRELVEKRVVDLVTNHPAIQAVQSGETLTDEQLIALERTLHQELSESDLELTRQMLRQAYGAKTGSFLALLREVLDVDAARVPDYEDIVQRRFDAFMQAHEPKFNADQVQFLKVVASQLAQRGQLDVAELYEGPFAAFGQNALDRYFDDDEIDQLTALTKTLSA